jgi:hypothetical protein
MCVLCNVTVYSVAFDGQIGEGYKVCLNTDISFTVLR